MENIKPNFYMWGERGLIATFFADLSQMDNRDIVKLLNTIVFNNLLNIPHEDVEDIDIIIEPDFGNAGFGHPDAVIAVQLKSNQRIVFILEAKQTTFERACKFNKTRADSGFNSTLTGQLELNYCLTLALVQYKDETYNTPLKEPYLSDNHPYKDERQSKTNVKKNGGIRQLKDKNVLEKVVAKLCGAPIYNYYHIVVTTDSDNPLNSNNLCKDSQCLLPQLFNKEGQNCWDDILRTHIGWINYQMMEEFLISKMTSFFLKTRKINK
jgi:hypothetical protein